MTKRDKLNEASFAYCQKAVRLCKCAACVHFLSCMDRKTAGSRLARYMAFIDVFVLPELTKKVSRVSEARITFKVAAANDGQIKRGGYCQIKVCRQRRSKFSKRKQSSVLLTGEESKKEIITIVTNAMIKKGWFKV